MKRCRKIRLGNTIQILLDPEKKLKKEGLFKRSLTISLMKLALIAPLTLKCLSHKLKNVKKKNCSIIFSNLQLITPTPLPN